jgi:hypothetical protein
MFGTTLRLSRTQAASGPKVIEDVPAGDRRNPSKGVKLRLAQMANRRGSYGTRLFRPGTSKQKTERESGEMLMRKFKYRMSVATLGAMAIFATAQANAAMFTLDNGNAALSGNAPPYGTVSITRIDNNDAKVTLTAFGLYSFGDGETLGLNLAGGGSFTMSSLSGTTLGTGPGNTPGAATIGSYSLEGLGNVDGWGNYNFRLKTFDGFKFSVTSLTFNIHTPPQQNLWVVSGSGSRPNV